MVGRLGEIECCAWLLNGLAITGCIVLEQLVENITFSIDPWLVPPSGKYLDK